MKNNRLFQLLYLLLEQERISAPELAGRLEVSVRTVYRDVEALSMAGVPIYAAQGKGGGRNADYCKYCYENGAFTFGGSMEEMIEFCVPHMVESNPNMTAGQARGMMQQFFPSLKRWQAQ